MKKILILTSAVALSACFGGGDSGTGGSSYVAPRAAILPGSAAASSNEKVTSMVSEILISSDRHSAVSPSRSATARYDGKTYTSYRLDDVTFKLSGEDSYVKFELDEEGKIIALTKYDRSDDFTGNPEYGISQEGRFVRTSDTKGEFDKSLYIYGYGDILDNTGIAEVASSHFNKPDDLNIMADSANLSVNEIKTRIIKEINKKIDKVKASQPDNSNDEALEHARAEYISQITKASSFDTPERVYANLQVEGVDIGLKYADLGFAELIVKENKDDDIEDAIEHNFTPYVGGYSVLAVDASDFSEEGTEFKGTAIAGIDHKKSGYGNDTNVKEGVLVRQNNATLTMKKDGSYTLLMDNLVRADNDSGQHWYVVQVDKSATGPTFTISGTNTITGTKEGVAAYNLPSMPGSGTLTKGFSSENWREYEQEYVDSSDNNYRLSGFVEANAYGTNETDIEATARFNFGNEFHSNDNSQHNSVSIYGAFGGGLAPTE